MSVVVKYLFLACALLFDTRRLLWSNRLPKSKLQPLFGTFGKAFISDSMDF